jgi:hypothetical protein
MKKVLSATIIVFSAFLACSNDLSSRVLHKDHGIPEGAPGWFKETIIPEARYIYAVGHSGPKSEKEEAKNEAIAAATEAFIRYCKVDVRSFDKSIEIYSKKDGINFRNADYETRTLMRTNAFVSRSKPDDWFIQKEKGKYKASVLLEVPREEFDRIVNEKDIKLSLDSVFYYENEKGKMRIMEEGSVLKSGDSFAIYIKPSDDCYLYVYQVDSMNKSFRLFPNSKYNTGPNPLAAGSDNWMPNSKQLYVLDETTGKEYFYIFASREPVSDFEGANALNLTKNEIDEVIKIEKMGVASVKDKISRQKTLAPKRIWRVVDIKKKLVAQGAFVYTTWLWHK